MNRITQEARTVFFQYLFLLLGFNLFIDMPTVFGQCTDFTIVGAMTQTYTVPAGVTAVKIIAKGADGGDSAVNSGGEGATAIGLFSVSPGDVLEVMVGEAGKTRIVTASSSMGSGGGGSGVSLDDGTILIVAGGGGGASNDNNIALGGNDSEAGTTAGGGGMAGTGGNGGQGGGSRAGGGGGILSAGGNSITGGKGGFVAAGGSVQEVTTDVVGGYGVGGGGGGRGFASGVDYSGGGGGGGYSGGSGGSLDSSNPHIAGGGGGSFIDASAMGSPQCLIAGEAGGGTGSDGMVSICPVTTLPAISITMVTPTMTNENSGTDFVFEFSRDLVECDLMVYFSVGGDVSPTDYTVQTGGTGMVAFDAGEGLFTITFPAGEATVDLTVEVENDNTVELSEELVVTVEADPNP